MAVAPGNPRETSKENYAEYIREAVSLRSTSGSRQHASTKPNLSTDYVLRCKLAADGRLASSGLRGQCRQPRVIVCCEDQRQPIGSGQSPMPGLLDEVVSLCAEH